MKKKNFFLRFVNNLFMWESSVPINNDNLNQTFGTPNSFKEQLINSYGSTPLKQIHEQGFQTCRSIHMGLDNHSSDDDQALSDDEDQGGITPKLSKRKGPNSFVLQLNVQNIHVAANAPMVKIEVSSESRE
jgi:hypothetical protein